MGVCEKRKEEAENPREKKEKGRKKKKEKEEKERQKSHQVGKKDDIRIENKKKLQLDTCWNK